MEPLEPVRTLEASDYRDPTVHAAERRAIFRRTWQLAGFRASLTEPGDYITHEIVGRDVIVIVQGDGTLRAFDNVCRHRAGPLVTDDAGHCTNFVCRYHGWSYALDGALRTTRDFGEPGILELDEFGLLPVQVDDWRGFVFVNLDPDARPLADELGPFFAAAADQPLESFEYGMRRSHDIAANWKTYADNYMEGYHIPLVHPGLNREVKAKEYHVDVCDHFCIHSVPTRDGAVNAGRWLWRYPNLALNIYPDGMNVERILPTGPGTTRVVYDFFFRDPTADDANRTIVEMGSQVLDEDRIICEAVQRNLEAGAYRSGCLSPHHEQGVAAFQAWVRESLAADGS